MAEQNRQPLLKRHYYENCPGCKVDQANEVAQGIPFRNLFNIVILVLCTTLPIQSLFPYLYFMVQDFHIAKREEDVGTYAGYVGSSFMLGRCLTSVFWGILADRYGRKPVMVIGVITVIIFSILFGLSSNFWMAISTRFLLGSLNGSMGPMKAYASEIVPEEYQTMGLSTLSASWGIGLILGPALGGYLAQPAEKYPRIFSKGSFWDKFPYFLPSLIISIFASGALILCIWLPETLHYHKNTDQSPDDSYEALENANSSIDTDKKPQESEGGPLKTNENLLLNWPLMSSIIVYCFFSLHDIAYQEVFSLWAVSPQRLGGLSFSSDDVGNVLAISGVALIFFQLTLYPYVERVFGAVPLARVSGVLTIPLLQSYTFIAMLSGFTLYLVINIANIFKSLLSVTINTSLFIVQNKAVEQHQRGAANGITMTAMSLFKAIGPAGAGAVFSWSEKRLDSAFLPGTRLVFFFLNVIEGIGVLMLFKPFLSIRRQSTGRQ
ncbi:Protein ZINC INDUCED FACILITATOR-LIKE 1 [Quillaja saponaria]|uniref:Protein ZINC INDUCED FACILITATOR-LIKE 1 n=1 Tax=Quillaja saponaria TaxID=32244 RepID=A0AAD7QJ90_QUISA|nr:Protein ZINC INDUCED FACILITATOR-LIKE 1 [Quillaja saponaria]